MQGLKLVGFFAAIILIGINQFPQEMFLAKTGNLENKEFAVIAGFRSVRFGMTEQKVLKAIRKDFNISKADVKRENNASEKTVSLIIDIPDLLMDGDLGRVVYIFGYKTKKLIQVNVIWGDPVTTDPDVQALVSTANALRDHFRKKEYTKDSLVLNQSLTDGVVLVFRGTDRKGRMVLLLLNNPPNQKDKKGKSDQTLKLSLRLSYIKNPTAPDIFRIKPEKLEGF